MRVEGASGRHDLRMVKMMLMMGDCGGCELGWWSRWNRRSAWIGSGVCMITSDEG